MNNNKKKLANLLEKKCKENPGILSTDGTILKCDPCDKRINYDPNHGQTILNKHLSSKTHRENAGKIHSSNYKSRTTQ